MRGDKRAREAWSLEGDEDTNQVLQWLETTVELPSDLVSKVRSTR